MTDLERFLGTIGRDDVAYRTVTNAQQAYTTSLLSKHPPHLDEDGNPVGTEAATTIRIGAHLQGILDRAWVDQYKADGAAQDRKFNDRVDKRAERQQMLAGVVTAGAFSFVPEAEEGLRATIVPLASDTANDELDSQIAQNISDYADSQHRNLDDVRQGKASEIFAAGREASWIPARQLLNASRLLSWTPAQKAALDESLQTAQETGYDTGSLTQEQGGNLAVSD